MASIQVRLQRLVNIYNNCGLHTVFEIYSDSLDDKVLNFLSNGSDLVSFFNFMSFDYKVGKETNFSKSFRGDFKAESRTIETSSNCQELGKTAGQLVIGFLSRPLISLDLIFLYYFWWTDWVITFNDYVQLMIRKL